MEKVSQYIRAAEHHCYQNKLPADNEVIIDSEEFLWNPNILINQEKDDARSSGVPTYLLLGVCFFGTHVKGILGQELGATA